MVMHNEKNRVVFNCSFTCRDQNLNELLLSGPNLGVSLLGVLLWFREHSTAVSSEIKVMFHQVRLLAEGWPSVCTSGGSFTSGILVHHAVPYMLFRGMCMITVIRETKFVSRLRSTCMWTTGCRVSLLQALPKMSSTRLRASSMPDVFSHLPKYIRAKIRTVNSG